MTQERQMQQSPTGDSNHTDFLVIGAGPFGLAMAAQAQALGVDHILVGQPMSFWKQHMPAGMVLRLGVRLALGSTWSRHHGKIFRDARQDTFRR